MRLSIIDMSYKQRMMYVKVSDNLRSCLPVKWWFVLLKGHCIVVKTYPSIDPIVAPPPPILITLYVSLLITASVTLVTHAMARLQAGIRLCGSACNTCITAS